MSGSEQFARHPNLSAAADIQTDKRQHISYVFAPIVDTTQGALGEQSFGALAQSRQTSPVNDNMSVTISIRASPVPS